MTVKEVFNSVLPAMHLTQAEAAEKLGWNKQQISQKMVRDSLRARELLQIMDLNGVDVVFRNRETGEEIKIMSFGHGHPIKGMSDGVKFNTVHADALSNNFYADGVNEYDENGEAQELYVDPSGRYFFAEYNMNDQKKERVRAVPASVAKAFIDKYGTVLEKGPKTETPG